MASNQMSSRKHESGFWAASSVGGQGSSSALELMQRRSLGGMNEHLHVEEPTSVGVLTLENANGP